VDAQKRQKQRDPSLVTLSDRRRRAESLRDETRSRDQRRFALAAELAREAALRIEPEQGFLVVEAGVLEPAQHVVDAGNELLDSIGHDMLVSGKRKSGYLTQNLLDPLTLPLDSPYMRFALSEDVVAPISAYLGLVPILARMDVWYSAYMPKEPRSSQLWHLDAEGVTQVKVWVHLSDITPESGPLTLYCAAPSEALAERIGYGFDQNRVRDEDVDLELDAAKIAPVVGPAGTVAFTDTSRCFHFGSRLAPGQPPRRTFLAQYLTPYSFRWGGRHPEEAPLRERASSSSSELERLVFGVD
jgi:hypothetical protein